MGLGDADLAVFFADGDPLSFNGIATYSNGRAVKGIVENLGKDATFENARVQDAEYRIELPWNAFCPMPATGDEVLVLAGRLAGIYRVRSADPVMDGATVELRLRKL
jgi:hypothetical protein